MQQAVPERFALKSQLSHEVDALLPVRRHTMTDEKQFLNDVGAQRRLRFGIESHAVSQMDVFRRILLNGSHQRVDFRAALEPAGINDADGEKNEVFEMAREKSLNS